MIKSINKNSYHKKLTYIFFFIVKIELINSGLTDHVDK